LFRHVRDLVIEQHHAGHEIGVICDANAHDPLTAPRLEALRPQLRLGLHLVPMARQVGFGDLSAYRAIVDLAGKARIDVIHGHGAKGGAYARLAAHRLKTGGQHVSGIYTPHGGSLHYSPATPQGQMFKFLERILCARSDAIIFESQFSQSRFEQRIGRPACLSAVIPNGLTETDFARHNPAPDAADILYVGEMRDLKGVDTLISAIAILNQERVARTVLVGEGPDRQKFQAMVEAADLEDKVSLPGAMPAQDAFAMGRCIVVPSRAESFPYIVLEAAAAALPMIATNVGGIPEITKGSRTLLITPDDSAALANAIRQHLDRPEQAIANAAQLRDLVRSRFTVSKMASDILSLYIATRQQPRLATETLTAVNQS